jgi:hypothetical protein
MDESVRHFSESFRETARLHREGERKFENRAREESAEIRRAQPIAEAQRRIAIALLNRIVHELSFTPEERAKTPCYSNPDNRAMRKATYLRTLGEEVLKCTKGEWAISPAAMKEFEAHTGEIDELILFVAKNMKTVPAQEARKTSSPDLALPPAAHLSQALRALRN